MQHHYHLSFSMVLLCATTTVFAASSDSTLNPITKHSIKKQNAPIVTIKTSANKYNNKAKRLKRTSNKLSNTLANNNTDERQQTADVNAPIYLDASYSDASYSDANYSDTSYRGSAYSNTTHLDASIPTTSSHNTGALTPTPVLDKSMINSSNITTYPAPANPYLANTNTTQIGEHNKAKDEDKVKDKKSETKATVTRPLISSLNNGNTAPVMATYELNTLTDRSTDIDIGSAYTMTVPSALSLMQAQQVLSQVSPKLAANNEAILASELQSGASEGLNKPIVLLRAQAVHYRLDNDIDLTSLKTGINDAVNDTVNNAVNDALDNIGVNTSVPNINIPPIVSRRLPDEYNLKRENSNVGANLAVLWPIYTAGRTDAITGVLDARTSEARADALMDSDELYTTLIERYFTAQLAIIGAYLREDALHTTEDTVYMAKRLFEEGFIAEVDYLEAQVALADAQSEAMKSRHDANLAMTALQRLLRTPYPIKPTTPLFVSSQPLPELSYFQEVAIANHPGLDKVDAKYDQADQLSRLSQTGLKPTVSVYGLHQIEDDPSWLVGVSASWKLWGGVDGRLQSAAGDAQKRQAMLTKIEVTDNIKLLVEKNWQAVENARIRYLALNSNVTLAEKLLHLKQLGLAEGLNTTLDVTTAQTKYQKARAEQAAAANDYVQALAALMESCGTPFAFNDYMLAADIRLPQLY